MPELNHFAIAAGMGAVLGPPVPVQHGLLGSAALAATMALSMKRRAYFTPLNKPKPIRRMPRAKPSDVRDLWRYAVASEMAARVMFFQYGASVDTTLAHSKLVAEFDKLASSITPGFSSFQYRWAALNMRKKGANVKLQPDELERLEWSKSLRFDTSSLPSEDGVYTLFERETCLFVAGTEDIEESVQSHKRIAEVPLFQSELWQPNPATLSWRYSVMPDADSDYRFGVVRSLVGRWEPIFNIPRGKHQKAA
jgi:hypothetical protein